MAIAVQRGGHEARLWGHDPAHTAAIAATRVNALYLPDVALPADVLVTTDAARALAGAEAVLVAVPTQHVRATVAGLAGALPAGVALVSLSKGLEERTGARPTEVLAAVAPGRPVLVLSGPSHAEEVARGLPAVLVIAGDGGEALQEHLQRELSHASLRVYRNDDPLGVELCGAVKNVMALAAGIAEGLGLGDNSKAAILSRGLVEMTRFGLACGAREATFSGIAGVGDLAVTTFSRHGRNRAFGERIGRGETLEQILASTPKVAEGVWTSRVVRERARALGIEMPICEIVCEVLFEGLPPRDAVAALMLRDPKPEER
ncbi:MAG: NAD(P)-dependent glycerol-3-phosphate dehydrogenase [Planctomycetes bacterium]|nr:NAD(P)-dependent glycerol-3-phosphate dehydrogenase [Planctomycetota bacterium]